MESEGDNVEKLCYCVRYVFNKLRDKKYLMFSFYSTSYIEDCSICIAYTTPPLATIEIGVEIEQS